MTTARHHVVLIPGFAGFDALGQLEYYAGVTPFFGTRDDAVLHYFDNFPTAAVATRAARLQAYLAKRIARGEIKSGDGITLVGHSTGGLDIRRLIYDLYRRSTRLSVDGGTQVEPDAILHAIRRVMFLSVPQWGTNIADWVRSHGFWREVVVAKLRAGFGSSQIPVINGIGEGLAGAVAHYTDCGLFCAVQDCLREADPHYGRPGFTRLAEAHEAASQLELYLRHIASDFRAIDDLCAARPPGGDLSPAHFTPAERERELRAWLDLRIGVRSYGTVAPPPFPFEPGQTVPAWRRLANPWADAEIVRSEGATDVVYRVCYRACAGGPFAPPEGVPWTLEPWENDGIVNTASMSWPTGDNILLHADHMDIVGHYRTAAPIRGATRSRAYDLLGSASRFDGAAFERLWHDVFAWAITGKLAAAAEAAPALG